MRPSAIIGLAWGRESGAQFHPDEPRFIEQANALDNGLPHDGIVECGIIVAHGIRIGGHAAITRGHVACACAGFRF